MNCRVEDAERLEKIEEIILELKMLAQEGAIIVVEGKRDVESLRLLGINGDIRQVSHKPLHEFAESLSRDGGEIILLTDWDKKGGIMAKKIIKYLLSFGVTPNTNIRSRICALVKKRIKDIESLNNYVNKCRLEIQGGFY